MSVAAPTERAQAFSPRTVLILILVGVVSLAALAVLAAYAPDLRASQDGRAHALSKSAVGYAGAPILMKALGQEALVSRSRPRNLVDGAMVLTPDGDEDPKLLAPFLEAQTVLVVAPKWKVMPDLVRKGAVRKVSAGIGARVLQPILAQVAPETKLAVGQGVTRPVLRGVGGPFAAGTVLPLGPIDELQTLSGDGWLPALVDDQGRMVLAYAKKNPRVLVLADPDLLNNQGLASLANARAGAAILDVLSDKGERPLIFDVTLNGFERGRGLGRLLLEPPWLAATLIAVAATILMGVHALARFGQPKSAGRPFALGARALVDNTAGLVRMARREHELAPDYAALTRAAVIKAGGGHVAEARWLADLARRRGLSSPDDLAAEADRLKTRDDLLAYARVLHEWRGEMTRERR